MEKVVYLLGAGFSAPLGLPVMSNFLEKSKDMLYSEDGEKYAFFNRVFQTIAAMGQINTYYEADLTNIEEILSILEMQSELSGKRTAKIFREYIAAVIHHCTPLLKHRELQHLSGNWQDEICGPRGRAQNKYGTFAASLLNLIIEEPNFENTPNREISLRGQVGPAVSYSVITLNYDLVLENCAEFLNRAYGSKNKAAFIRPTIADIQGNGEQGTIICKLHGSIDTDVLVPPTWNKSLHKQLLPDWQAAYAKLVNANHIRVIGYSLPVADSYFKYLLKAAISQSRHLKRIDVLCLDDRNGSTKKRFDEFIRFPKYRFVNGDVEDYLQENVQRLQAPIDRTNHIKSCILDKLEAAHDHFFRDRSA